MNLRLDDDIYENNIEYFFSLHGPRFEYMNDAMAASLSKRFGKEFRPIRILNAWPSKQYDTGNYIVLNDKSYGLAKNLDKPVVYLPDYEDVNIEFTQNKSIQDIATKLVKKQKTIYVYPFTTSFLELSPDIFTILGPNNHLAKKYDNKINQVKLFEQLGLPRNNVRIFEDEAALLANEAAVTPCYLSAAYTSGGNESGLIYDSEMLHAFLTRLRPINKQSHFLVADIFDDLVVAPNVTALITNEGKTYVLIVSDQILQGNRYLGNLYPSIVNDEHLKQIHETIQILGDYLAKENYRGLFGCDFLINRKGGLVIVDLNPRHQGGYACNGLALKQKGISLTDIELATLLSEDVILSQKELSKKLDFAWSHSKLVPIGMGQIVQKEYSLNDIELPFDSIGESFAVEFYKKGSVFIDGYIGYQVQTALSRGELIAKMQKAREKYDSQVLGL